MMFKKLCEPFWAAFSDYTPEPGSGDFTISQFMADQIQKDSQAASQPDCPEHLLAIYVKRCLSYTKRIMVMRERSMA